MTRIPGLDPISKQRQIAMLAREAPQLAFTALSHHIDMNWMKEAFRRTRKDGATGIDGQPDYPSRWAIAASGAPDSRRPQRRLFAIFRTVSAPAYRLSLLAGHAR